MRASDISFCIDIVKLMSTSPLQKYIACYTPTNSTGWGALCDALSLHCNNSSLVELNLNDLRDDPGNTLGFHGRVGGKQLKPILVFSNLTTVTLDPAGLDVDDAMVMAMAKAWPHLQLFSLGEDNCTRYSPEHI